MKQYYYYKIINQETGNFYIGITEHLQDREMRHFSALSKNKHVNYKLQQDYKRNLYKMELIETLVYTTIEEAYQHEKDLIDTLKPYYNIAPGGLVNPMYNEEIRKK